MGWKVWARPITTAEGSSGIYQKIKFNSNIVLTGCRIWLLFYNDPAVTNVSMKIYSDNGGSPGKLLHTSSKIWTKAQIISLENGVKEIYFDWNRPSFDGDDYYHFGLFMSGYTGDDSSHIAWRTAWPDPVYTTNFTPTLVNVGTAPHCIYFIGSTLA